MQLDSSVAVKSFVLRIFQEFMQNSLKHARCSKITVTITELEEGIAFQAADDGIGFEGNADENHRGLGLNNMKTRAEMMHADFTLTSAPGAGTIMRLYIPSDKLNTF
jgi:signal transduction histidine kinase